jgi:hypothetical protein
MTSLPAMQKGKKFHKTNLLESVSFKKRHGKDEKKRKILIEGLKIIFKCYFVDSH